MDAEGIGISTLTLSQLPTSVPRPAATVSNVISVRGHTYELTRLVGEGAVGRVYMARRQWSKRRPLPHWYAVKLLEPLQRIAATATSYQRIARRFLGEAQRGRYIRHPHIVRMVDWGQLAVGSGGATKPQPITVMRYVDGSSVDRLLTTPSASIATRLDWVIQLGGAVEYLHTHGMFHRDIKPHNVMIRPSGSLVLGDLGVIHWADFYQEYTDEVSTLTQEILTTWDYVPPEVETAPHTYDRLSDAWAFGKTALEILTWRRSKRVEVLLGRVPDTIDGCRALPRIVNQLLSNDPATRFSIPKALEQFRRHRHLGRGLAGLSQENVDRAVHCTRTFGGWIEPWHDGSDGVGDDLREDVQHLPACPDKFLGPIRCKRCGSPFVQQIIASLGDYDYWVCYGHPGRPCGAILLREWDTFFGESWRVLAGPTL